MGFRTQGIEQNSKIQQGAFLVYIAGVHIPASSVSVDFSVQSFPTATINMPADNTLIKLGEEDRVPVAIFFLDKWYSAKDPSKGVKPTWRLLFDGDITQWGYQRSAYNRSMSVRAISHNSVLNTMSLLYLDGTSRDLITKKSKADTELQRTGRTTDMQVVSFFKQGAYGNGNIKTPINFIKNLLLGMKIGGTPKGEIAKPATTGGFDDPTTILDDTLKNVSSSNVNSASFKDIRVPSIFPVSASSEFFIKYNHRNKVDKRWIASTIEDVSIMGSGAQISDPDKEHETTSVDVNGKTTTTKKISDESFIAKMQQIIFDSARHNFSQKRSPVDTFWNLIQEFYGTVMYNVIQIPTAQHVYVNSSDVPKNKKDISADSQRRLGNYISVPNMSFALPPACNVFTPAMVEGFNFQEDYASQNTRVIADGSYLNPASKGTDAVNNVTQAFLRYGYPSDQQTIMSQENTNKKSPDNILIYPEEYFKGPVVSRPKAPKFFLTIEQASLYEIKSNAKDSYKQTKALLNKDTIPSSEGNARSTVSARSWRQELLYAFTKSFYLENRYSARQGTINMAFNPYVIPGMTFAMLDGDDFDQFHLTGLITAVTITMSNSGVSTSVAYTAGRTLKEVYEQVFTENTFGPDTGVTDRNVTNEETNTDIYTTAPIIPVRTLANTLQTDALAKSFYQSLLYTNDEITNENVRAYVFKHENYFNSSKGSKLKEDHDALSNNLKAKLTGNSGDKTFPGTITNIKARPKTATTPEGIGSFNLDLKIKDEEFSNINDYELSMRRAARPICSIKEYINMFNIAGDITTIDGLYENSDEFGIEYPIKIRVYVVNADELGDNFIRPYAKQDGFDSPIPELRRDWPSKMLEYRKRVKANSILGR